MLFCTSCGKKLNEGASFCDGCGAKSVGVKPTPAEAPYPGVPTHSKEAKTNIRDSSEDEYSTLTPVDAAQVPIGGQVGRVLGGRYQLDDCIGSGGMGEIYSARRLHIGDKVAVKVLRPDVVENEKSRQRFYREARAAAMLHHPNAVVIHDFGEDDDGTTYIVMELLLGRSLRQLLVEEGVITPSRAYKIIRQACAAIDAGHRNGIVHRDIKPDNIVLISSHDDTEMVKILDFGIAKVLDSAIDTHSLEQRLTNFGTVIGTPHYMSPEQCQGEEADARSDIYSIGVVLYELLTGVAPFVAKTPTGIAIKHVTEPPRPLREINPGITPSVEKVVLRSLEKNPNERQQSALDLARELEAALSNDPETIRFESSREVPITVVTPDEELEEAEPAAQEVEPDSQSEQPAVPASYDTVISPSETEVLDQSETGHLSSTATSENRLPGTAGNLREEAGTEIISRPETTDSLGAVKESNTSRIGVSSTGRIDAGTEVIQPEGTYATTTGEKIEPKHSPAPVSAGRTPRLTLPLPKLAGAGAVVLLIASVGLWWGLSGSSDQGLEDAATVASNAAETDSQLSSSPSSDYPEVAAPEGMVYVLGGVLRVGRDEGEENERPAHVVTIKPFFMDRTEVSNERYREFVEATGYAAPPSWNGGRYAEGADQLPVVDVTWEDATAFATWTGKRLPTEEEWEFAARGPEGRIYPWGEKFINDAANISTKVGENRRLAPVGQFANNPSVFGILDLVGNAWEWTASDYAPYPGGKIENPGSGYKNLKVIRGGSYESTPRFATTTIRRGWPASRKDWPNPSRAVYSQTGFRCAMDAGN